MKFTDPKNGGVPVENQNSRASHGGHQVGQDLIVGRQRTSRNENADYSGTVQIRPQPSSSTRNNLYKASQKSVGISKHNQQTSSSIREQKSQAGGQGTAVTRQESQKQTSSSQIHKNNLKMHVQQSSILSNNNRQKVSGGMQEPVSPALTENENQAQKNKRTKERTIQEIIEKVSTWRKLYNGVIIPNATTGEFQLQRWSLEDAAKKVKVSKKSLDDYLLQLRFGKKFGFDFPSNSDKKVGVLRCFVKQMKDKLKQKNGNKKMSSKLPLQQSANSNGGKRGKGDDEDDIDEDFDDGNEDSNEEPEAPHTAGQSPKRRKH